MASEMTGYDFVGTGWAFPPSIGPSGGIALVAREQEIEQAIQIILLTYLELPLSILSEYGGR